MKVLLLILLTTACTRKYVDYDLIRKVDFQRENYQRPVTMMQVLPTGEDHLEACFNQWLFFSNAAEEKETAVPYLVRSLCPGKDYLMNAELEDTWWTTILFTRACVSVETKCGELKKEGQQL